MSYFKKKRINLFHLNGMLSLTILFSLLLLADFGPIIPLYENLSKSAADTNNFEFFSSFKQRDKFLSAKIIYFKCTQGFLQLITFRVYTNYT